MFETRVTISVKQLLFALVLFSAMLAMFSIAQGQPTEAPSQAASEPAWTMHTNAVAETRKSWDAYLLNVNTGEVFFVNQAVKTLVTEGIAKGTKKPIGDLD